MRKLMEVLAREMLFEQRRLDREFNQMAKENRIRSAELRASVERKREEFRKRKNKSVVM